MKYFFSSARQKIGSGQVQRGVRGHQHHQQREVCGQNVEARQEEEDQARNQDPGKSPGRHQHHHPTGRRQGPRLADPRLDL